MDPVPCVGAIVRHHDGRLLLVRRGREPDRGRWSVPGGKVEPGEGDRAACAREVLEETALRVDVGTYVGSVRRNGPDGVVYDVTDFVCTLASGVDPSDVRAGDDADDARWFTPDEVRTLECSTGLVEALEGWGLLPPADRTGRPAAGSGPRSLRRTPARAHDRTVAGHYLHWGVISISLTNALIIVAMVVVFVLALLLPFPHGDGGRRRQ